MSSGRITGSESYVCWVSPSCPLRAAYGQTITVPNLFIIATDSSSTFYVWFLGL